MKLQLVDFSGRLALMTYYPGYQDWWRHVSGVVVTALHCSVAIVTTSSPQSDVLMMEGGLILSPTFAPSDGVMALHCSALCSALVQRSPALYFLSVGGGGPQQGGTNNGQLFDLKHETNYSFMTYLMLNFHCCRHTSIKITMYHSLPTNICLLHLLPV